MEVGCKGLCSLRALLKGMLGTKRQSRLDPGVRRRAERRVVVVQLLHVEHTMLLALVLVLVLVPAPALVLVMARCPLGLRRLAAAPRSRRA